MLVEEGLRRQDHSGGTEPALDGPFLDKGLLEGMEVSVLAQAFDG